MAYNLILESSSQKEFANERVGFKKLETCCIIAYLCGVNCEHHEHAIRLREFAVVTRSSRMVIN